MKLPAFEMLDLSVALSNSQWSDPPPLLPKIDYKDHAFGAGELMGMFPGLRREDLLNGEGIGSERLNITAHNGTHMDAPWHYGATMRDGSRAMTIDELPLEWCLQPGVKLDFRDMPSGHVVSAAEIEAELARIGHELQPLEIVLMNTAAGAMHGRQGYVDTGCGFGREATLYLLERGVRVVGTDGWSWDAPFSYTRKLFEQNADPAIIWEGHIAGREIGYGQMEKLTNLERLPADGFWVSCFPYKIEGGSAGFTRAVALLPAHDR
jgi:kynurenine formamidase